MMFDICCFVIHIFQQTQEKQFKVYFCFYGISVPKKSIIRIQSAAFVRLNKHHSISYDLIILLLMPHNDKNLREINNLKTSTVIWMESFCTQVWCNQKLRRWCEWIYYAQNFDAINSYFCYIISRIFIYASALPCLRIKLYSDILILIHLKPFNTTEWYIVGLARKKDKPNLRGSIPRQSNVKFF